jgi:5-methylcytosine-specific restriction endonuclease McrA
VNREQALTFLEKVEFRVPGPAALESLRPSLGKRQANLGDLKQADPKVCAWCNSNPIQKGRRKYCSPDCLFSAETYCRPQSPQTKAWLFIHRQSCACSACGLSFEDQVIRRIQRKLDDHREAEKHWKLWNPKKPYPFHNVTYYSVGYGTGEQWEVDHVVPLHKGGIGIGLENVQVICTKCHRRKSGRERSKGDRTSARG